MIKEEMKLSGYFWLPKNEKKQIPGTLYISKNGDIELEILGKLSDSEDFETDIPIICGNVENKNYITLEDSFYVSQGLPFPDMISKSKIISNYAYLGVTCTEKNNLMFDEFTFSLDGITEWIGKSGIDVSHSKDYTETDVKYKKLKDLEYELIDGYKLIFLLSGSIYRSSGNFEVKFTQRVKVKIVSKTLRSLKEFINLSWKIINFFSFSINNTLSIKDVKVTSKDITRRMLERDIPVEIETIYKSTNYIEDKYSYHPYKMLFTFADIESNFEAKIKYWLQNYKVIEPTLNLYFSVKQNNHTHIESEFLFLIQALETYHRRTSNEKFMEEEKYKLLTSTLMRCCPEDQKEWLEGKLKFGNEISLRKRIQQLIEPFKDLIGTNKERKSIIGKIVDTRNYLTHYNKDLKNNAVEGIKLINVNKKLEGLLELSFLKELKFSDKEIVTIFNRHIKKQFTE